MMIAILAMLMGPGILNAEYAFHSVDTFPGPNSRILFGDTDHDGFVELFIFRRTGDYMGQIDVFERNAEDQYTLTRIIDSSSIPIVIGDGDADGLSDICARTLINEDPHLWSRPEFLESSTLNSFPENFVGLFDTFLAESNNMMYPGFSGQYIDADCDGRQEAIIPIIRCNSNTAIWHTGLAVLEHTADNTLMLKNLLLPLGERGSDIYDFAIGDTDLDGFMEVAFCTFDGYPFIYNAFEDNRFDLAWAGDDHSAIWSTEIGDYNNNGVPEIIFAGKWGFEPIVKFYVYEWNGQTYEQIQYFENHIVGGDLYDSTCTGDVDGDGIPELINLTTAIDVFKCDEFGQMQRIVRITDPEITSIDVYVYSVDLNGNGFSEIIYTGSGQGDPPHHVVKIIEIDPASAPGPAVPTPTQTPVPTPVVPNHIEYQARSVGNIFSYGLPFRLFTESVNPFEPREALVLIALECEGMLWFYPSWCDWPDIDYLQTTIPSGIDYQILLEFEWPQMTGWGDATLWSLVWDATTYDMISIYNWPFTFGEGY